MPVSNKSLQSIPLAAPSLQSNQRKQQRAAARHLAQNLTEGRINEVMLTQQLHGLGHHIGPRMADYLLDALAARQADSELIKGVQTIRAAILNERAVAGSVRPQPAVQAQPEHPGYF